MPDDPRQPGASSDNFLENRLRALDAVYRRYGREALRDYPLGDATMLLAAKRLELRDTPGGRDATDNQKAARRLLELEIRDLSGHVDAQLSGAGLSTLQRTESRLHQRADRPDPSRGQQTAKPRPGPERE